MNISSKTKKDRVVIVVIDFSKCTKLAMLASVYFINAYAGNSKKKKKSAKKPPAVRIELGTSCVLS